MRRTVNNILSVIYSYLRFSVTKLLHGKRFTFFPLQRFSPLVVFEMNRGAKVTLGKKVRVHSGSKIKIRPRGVLSIGDEVRINYNCIIVCRKKISIGAGTEFGPSVYIYDHDHDYKNGFKKELFKESEVKIGKNCWIGANTLILRGVTIGDNCVIAAGSLITHDVPSNSLVIQKRDTRIRTLEQKP